MSVKFTRRALLAFGTAAAMLGAGLSAPAFAQSKDVVIFAAASLKNALDEASAEYTKATSKKVTISYAASSALARQIESGGPADMFVSADLDWMNYLAGKNLIKPETRSNLLGNRIVLVGPSDSKLVLTIAPNFALADALGKDGRLAVANVDSVPAGKYGKAALETLGVWGSVSSRIVQADDVRATLAFVARGEAPLGIVYRTDAAAEPKVKIVGMFPENTHPPIIYPIAAIASSTNPDMAAFIAFLRTAGAKHAFEKQGFTILAPSS